MGELQVTTTDADAVLDLLDGAVKGDAESLIETIATRLAIVAPIALERAASLYSWRRIWQAVHGADRGGDRKSAAFRSKNQNEKISFCSEAAKRLGLTERAIQLDLQLADDLGPADIRRLWSSKIADNAASLRVIAALPAERRSSLYVIWTREPGLSFGDLLIKARLKAERDSEEEELRRLADAWSSASVRVRRKFLGQLGVHKKLIDAVLQPGKREGAAE